MTVYHSETHWLSEGKILQRFLSLLEDNKVFVVEQGQPVSDSEDSSWVPDLALLTNICGFLKQRNSKLQGKCQILTELYNVVSAFE
jgi:hypothetical protein